ncbi:hypothetical protein [Pumilibacter muris]|uniref:hypothetical protein n=1 Tax=Pumilibacter muris TaxID=2941510 RepID=UPI00203E365D|nr:hypothetical protein [Pumilibacter muris]
MIKTKRTILYAICAAVIIFFTAFSSIPRRAVISYAANTDINFDETNVIDDLKNSVIDGKDYSIEENNFFADFNFDSKKPTQLFSLVEYCYSFYSDLQGNYALYAYVYNPKGIKYIADSAQNKISMRFGSDKSVELKKYSLLFLSVCTEPNYEGLFYKYKVMLPGEERQRVLETLNSTERVYTVGEIELQKQDGIIESYYVATDYFYGGYAAGYGPNSDADSTLTIKSEECDTLPLDVHPTFFRPSGTNESSDYTQDTLHSVYFSVPNKYLNLFGEMTAVHALWLNTVTNWGLVIGDKSSYDTVMNYVGKTDLSGMDFCFIVNHRSQDFDGTTVHFGDYMYNEKFCEDKWTLIPEESIPSVHYAFWAGDGADSADHFTVSSETLMDWMKDYTSKNGGKLLLNKYSEALFSSVDKSYTEVNWDYKKDWSDKLTSQTLKKSFWDKLFGGKGTYVTTDTFSNVMAIKELTKEDFLDLTTAEICHNLYIQEDDYLREETGLKAVYTKATENGKGTKDSNGKRDERDSTVFLFRYRISEFFSAEADRCSLSKYLEALKDRDSNNYFFKQSVDLNFDIIDVTFSNGEVNTVIPVAMSPIDIIHSATPPVYTTSDKDGGCGKTLSLVFTLIIVVLLLVVATPFLPYIVSGIVWVVKLPIRAVSGIAKGVKKSRNKNKKDGT